MKNNLLPEKGPTETTAAAHIQEASMEQIIDGRDQCRYLLEVLNAFPPTTRDVFLLARFERMSYAEISGRCGISIHMVKNHMIKTIAKVKAAQFRRRGHE